MTPTIRPAAALATPREAPRSLGPAVLVDAHVHCYACFPPAEFLSGADQNVRRAATELGLGEDHIGCLMLAETAGDEAFDTFAAEAGADLGGGWTLCRTREDLSLVAEHEGHPRLVMIAGRQVVSAEGLEVLALGTRQRFRDGTQMDELLDLVRSSGAVAVLPWGAGKWWRRRGACVARVLRSRPATEVFLGDNGGRPHPAPRPRLFRLAEELGVRILPGTDPLPLRSQAGRAGRFGFLLRCDLDDEEPARRILEQLRKYPGQPPVYGRRSGWLEFGRNQTLLRVRKWLR